jgi:cytoskeletal protein CcmA (bactofilin family)
MRHTRSRAGSRLLVILGLGLLLALWASPVAAIQTRSGELTRLAAGETIDDDLAISGESVSIGGRVTGDVFAAGNTVTILPGAQIDGDLFAAANTVIVDGAINGSIRAAASAVQVNGTVGRNVLAAGAMVTLGSNAAVKGNWMSGSSEASLRGTIGGTAAIGATRAMLAGAIGKDVKLGAEQVTAEPTARIGGSLEYYSDREQPLPAGVVQGQTRFIATPEAARQQARGDDGGFNWFGLVMLVGSVLFGLLLAWLTPGLYRAGQRLIERRALVVLGVGLLALVSTPILAILAMVTGVGLLPGLVGLGAYLIAWYVGWIVAATALAAAAVGLLRRGAAPLAVAWSVVLGLIVVYLLTLIPFLGGVVSLVVICLGLGLLVLLAVEAVRRRQPPAPAPALPATDAPVVAA